MSHRGQWSRPLCRPLVTRLKQSLLGSAQDVSLPCPHFRLTGLWMETCYSLRVHTHTHTHEHTRKENLASQRVSLMPLISQPQRLCGLSPSPHTAARLHGSRIPRLPVLLPPPGHHLPSFQLFKPCPLLRVQPGGFASTVRLSWGPSALF